MAASIPSGSPIPSKIPALRLVGPTTPKFHKTRPTAPCERKSPRISDICRDKSVDASAEETVGRRGDGAQRRIRTTDTRIFSPLLYQLSYLGLRRLTGSSAGFHGSAGWRPPRKRVGYSTGIRPVQRLGVDKEKSPGNGVLLRAFTARLWTKGLAWGLRLLPLRRRGRE